jgi:biopolymer transport protein ExbD
MPFAKYKFRESTFSGRLNLVPMIDIVFQLIVFFMVASHLVTTQRDTIAIPQPKNSQAREKDLPNRLVISISSSDQGKIIGIRANSDLVPDVSALVDLLLRFKPASDSRQISVVLRADKNLKFSEIETVLRGISNSGITSLHIAAERDGQGTMK